MHQRPRPYRPPARGTLELWKGLHRLVNDETGEAMVFVFTPTSEVTHVVL